MSSNSAEVESESKLIEQVRDYKLLYDKRVDAYRSKIKRSNAWKEIGSALNLSGHECQKSWNSLRSQYMAHRRKLKNPSKSAAGTRPYFRHETSMQFLVDAAGEESTYTNLKENTAVTIEEEEEVVTVDNTLSTSTISEGCDSSKTPRVTPNENETRVHEKFGKKRKLDAFDEELIKFLRSDGNTDEFKIFGDFVGMKL